MWTGPCVGRTDVSLPLALFLTLGLEQRLVVATAGADILPLPVWNPPNSMLRVGGRATLQPPVHEVYALTGVVNVSVSGSAVSTPFGNAISQAPAAFPW